MATANGDETVDGASEVHFVDAIQRKVSEERKGAVWYLNHLASASDTQVGKDHAIHVHTGSLVFQAADERKKAACSLITTAKAADFDSLKDIDASTMQSYEVCFPAAT
jgi:hypothetical protein